MSKVHTNYLKYGAKFYNKDGTLTRYSLACGYIEFYSGAHSADYIRLELDGTYHIKGSIGCDRRIWEVTDSLTTARKLFAAYKKEIKQNDKKV